MTRPLTTEAFPIHAQEAGGAQGMRLCLPHNLCRSPLGLLPLPEDVSGPGHIAAGINVQ